jgi:hypothetical protein
MYMSKHRGDYHARHIRRSASEMVTVNTKENTVNRAQRVVNIRWLKALTECFLQGRTVTLLNPEEPMQALLF